MITMLKRIFIMLALAMVSQACSISYTFNGAILDYSI